MTVSLLVQSGCNVNRIPPTGEIIYDIRGEWTINRVFGDTYSTRIVCTFTGTETKGTVTPESGRPGTYDVGGETGIQVQFFLFTNEYGEEVFES